MTQRAAHGRRARLPARDRGAPAPAPGRDGRGVPEVYREVCRTPSRRCSAGGRATRWCPTGWRTPRWRWCRMGTTGEHRARGGRPGARGGLRGRCAARADVPAAARGRARASARRRARRRRCSTATSRPGLGGVLWAETPRRSAAPGAAGAELPDRARRRRRPPEHVDHLLTTCSAARPPSDPRFVELFDMTGDVMSEPLLGGMAQTRARPRASRCCAPGNTNCGGCGMSVGLQCSRARSPDTPVQLVDPRLLRHRHRRSVPAPRLRRAGGRHHLRLGGRGGHRPGARRRD